MSNMTLFLLLLSSFVAEVWTIQTIAPPRIKFRYFPEFSEDKIDVEGSIVLGEEFHLSFSVPSERLRAATPRILTLREGPDEGQQLLVTVRHPGGQFSWQQEDRVRERLICQLNEQESHSNSSKLYTVIVSTHARSSVAFKVEVTMEESLIAEGVNKKAIVTPGSPYVWTYHARGATETDGSDEHPLATGGGRGRDPQQQPSSLRIYARSEDTDYCGLIAVQPLVCPFHDSESDVQFYSRWQTMLGQAIIDIKLDGKFANGFFIVAITKEKDYDCLGRESPGVRMKEVTLTLTRDSEAETVRFGSLAVCAFYVISGIFAITASFCFNVPVEGKITNKLRKLRESTRTKFKRSRKSPVKSNVEVDEVDATPLPKSGSAKMPNLGVPSGQEVSIEAYSESVLRISLSDVRLELPSERMPNLPTLAHTVPADQLSSIKTVTIDDSLSSLEDDVVMNRISSNEEPPLALHEDDSDMVDFSVHPVMVLIRREVQSYLTETGTLTKRPEAQTSVDQVVEGVFKKQRRKKLQEAKAQKKRQTLTLADLSLTYDKELFPDTLRMKSSLYLWIILVVGIFYTLPVIQLLISNQHLASHEGHLDTCYYNFLCKVSFGYLEDFGHVFSNISYIISGVFFVTICAVRAMKKETAHGEETEVS